MQVQKIQDNNGYNAHFKAKSQFEGAVHDLPQTLKKQIEDVVTTIGNDSDIISINVGRKCSEELTWKEIGHPNFSIDYYRDTNIASYISGKLKQHSLRTDASFGIKEDMRTLGQSVLKYLNSLGGKK